jgi:predicted RNA binding protein YcfA (HicA-like mRNA interferase family)
MKFYEIERVILRDGWRLKTVNGSHYQYVHPVKKGKVTIPYHPGDLDTRAIRSIMKQAKLK